MMMILDRDREIKANSLIREYLKFGDYPETLKSFDSETSTRGRPPLVGDNGESKTEIEETVEEEVNRFLIAFREGDRVTFFSLWDQRFPASVQQSDSLYQRLEFQLSIYFAVFPIQGHVNQMFAKNQSLAETMDRLKHFLETRGAVLCKTTQFLPYYALPYVPDPQNHPSFTDLFSKKYVTELEDRMVYFLKSALKALEIPRILKILSGVDTRTAEQAEDQKREIMQLKKTILSAQLAEQEVINKHRSLQNDYHNLITIASELVHTLAACINGEKRLAAFKRGGHLQKQRTENFDLPEPRDSVSSRRQSAETPKRTGFPAGLEANLNFDQVRRELANVGVEEDAEKQALILQGLRKILLSGESELSRANALKAFVDGDVLGLKSEKSESVVHLLERGSSMAKEQLARLLHMMSSQSIGRKYLLSGEGFLIPYLTEAAKSEMTNSASHLHLLGTLQKLSIRPRAQTAINNMNISDHLLQMFSYTEDVKIIECGVALFMNLCHRSSGRKQCADDPMHTLRTLIGLFQMDNIPIKTYVNGALLSLLNEPEFREAAAEINLSETLSDYAAASPDEGLQNQISFVLEHLQSADDYKAEDSLSDGNADDDGDEGEDEDDYPSDSDVADDHNAIGAELLQLHYTHNDRAREERRKSRSGNKTRGGGMAGAGDAPAITMGSLGINEISAEQKTSQDPAIRPRSTTSPTKMPPLPSGESGVSLLSPAEAELLSGKDTRAVSDRKKENAARLGNISTADREDLTMGFTTRSKLARTPL
ncbi:LisH domain-containing protein armc9 [Blyttiomyces sp. JEL0837]|nr:LisH domain-containing protein armc9 [Blyttiomyces sp. JEL0837]